MKYLLMLASLFAAACAENRALTIGVVAVQQDAVTLNVKNDSGRDLVLLSPAEPAREVDEARCAVRLSTKVDERIEPFAFTPRLITVRARTEMRIRAELRPLTIPASCKTVVVSLEYAFLRADEVDKRGEDFRRYVLAHQQVVTLTIITPQR
jgi:hypothetical protein